MSEKISAPSLHPSYFELDRMYLESHRAARESGIWDAHVQHCTQCQQHLAQLRAHVDEAAPGWVRAERSLPAGSAPASLGRRLGQWLRRPMIFGPPLLATSAALVLIIALRPQPPATTPHELYLDSIKGGPAVGVYIKRGEGVARWDGHTPLRPRDRIRLEVAGAGFPYLTVAFAHATGVKILYAGALPTAAPTQLPASWQLDAEGDREVLFILLSGQPLPAASIDIAQLQKDRRVWVRELVLRKVQIP